MIVYADSAVWKVYRDSEGRLIVESLSDGLIDLPLYDTATGKLVYSFPGLIPRKVKSAAARMLTS